MMLVKAVEEFAKTWHGVVPLLLALLCCAGVTTGKKRSRAIGKLDRWRRGLGFVAFVGRLATTTWSKGDMVLPELASALAVLLMTLMVHVEAKQGRLESLGLRWAWLLTATSAVVDVVFAETTWRRYAAIVVWTLATLAAGLLYVLWNAGARRTKGRVKKGVFVAGDEYDELEDGEEEEEEEETPEDAAGPLSTIVFSWMSPLLALGYSRPLESEDLYPLIRADDPANLATKLRTAFEVRRKKGMKAEKALLGALVSAFGGYYFVGCGFKFIYDTCQLAQPLLLSALLKALGHLPNRTKDAYLISLAIVLNAMLSTSVLHQYFQRTYRTGMRLKSSATSLVFEKALRARNIDTAAQKAGGVCGAVEEEDKKKKKKKDKEDEKAGAKSSTVQNLMSVDAQRLQDSLTYMATIGSGIYQIIACLYLLYEQLGVSAFAGTSVMIVFLPITQKVILASRRFQAKVLVHKDARIKLQSEALSGVKIIKLYAYEKPLSDELKRLRNKELEALWSYKLVSVLSRVVYAVVPTAVSLCTFATYSLLLNRLTFARVYTSLALFNILRFPLMMVPRAIGNAVEAMLSVDRIGHYLASDEVTPLGPLRHEASISARNADLDWPAPMEEEKTPQEDLAAPLLENDMEAGRSVDRTLLRGLTLDLRPGSLTAVIGETGSGKTGFLVSLLGETSIVGGSLDVQGSIAYCAQAAWIQNATVKENILFGAPFDQEKYDDVVFRAALEQDLKELKDGDETEIGEKGLNISGGQKQRVALARALYADAEVYLFDDVLSAVDAHVASHLFEHLVLQLRELGKVVVLVTHNLSTLRKCDLILCLSCPKKIVEYQGPPAGFIQLGIDQPTAYPLAAIAAKKGGSNSNLAALADAESSPKKPSKPKPKQISAVRSSENFGIVEDEKKDPTDDDDDVTDSDTDTGALLTPKAKRALTTLSKRTKATRLVTAEGRVKGGTSKRTRLAYLKAFGGLGAVGTVIVCQIWYQLSSVAASWWLGYWSAKPKTLGTALGLEVYTGLSVAAVVLSCIAYYAMSLAGQRAARRMHDNLLDGLLYAPMEFFDSTPVGRLINLFSKDLYTIDEELPQTLTMWLTVLAMVLMTIATITFATPWFLAVAAPLGLIYMGTQRYFIPTVRELKRLDATSRSPIFSSFSETLDGATTIRAFRAQDRFYHTVTQRLRTNLRAYFLGTACNRWLAVRLEGLGTAITGSAAILTVAMRTKPYLAGLSLTYALSVTQALNWFVRMNADLENNSVAVERVVEYTNVDHELDGTLRAPPRNSGQTWPSAGHIKVENLELRYRPELPLVLKGLNFEVAPGTKLSLVGRTGSGKSSFLLALLRIAPPTPSSKIIVDGLDVTKMNLSDLRSRIAMIPQDPVLFTGTVRFNVDPFAEKADVEIRQALTDARLSERLQARANALHTGGTQQGSYFQPQALPDVLSLPVDEGGKNFSQGEAQLLCLARACLRYSKLLLLDEATSSVDQALDDAIQDTIRVKFAKSTIICTSLLFLF